MYCRSHRTISHKERSHRVQMLLCSILFPYKRSFSVSYLISYYRKLFISLKNEKLCVKTKLSHNKCVSHMKTFSLRPKNVECAHDVITGRNLLVFIGLLMTSVQKIGLCKEVRRVQRSVQNCILCRALYIFLHKHTQSI